MINTDREPVEKDPTLEDKKMASRHRDVGSKQSSDRPRRRHPLGPRSKTMIEETTTSRYRGSGGEESPGLGRRYGSARYYRKNTDLKSFDDATISPSYTHGISPRQPISTSGKYTSSVAKSTRPDINPLHYGRSSSFSHENTPTQYSGSRSTSKGPLYLDFTRSGLTSKEKTSTSSGRDSSALSRLPTSSYKTRYPSPTHEDSKIKTDRTKAYSPTSYQKDRGRLTPSPDITKGSSSRSSSLSSRGSSTVSSRKSSTSSTGRDRVAYLGSYSGRASPDDTTSQNISLLSQHITRTFHPEGRRSSADGALPERSPFLRSYSLRSDYTSRYVQHQVRERKYSSPVQMTLHKQTSLPERKDSSLLGEKDDERSRKGSWLQSRKKSSDSSEKGERSDSNSPSNRKKKPSLSSRLSSSNESNTEIAQAPAKRKFSVPSKYFSSRETMSRESSGGSSEVLDSSEISRARKKYSLPGKLSFRKRSTSIERTAATSKSEPGSPDRHFEEIRRGRSGSFSSDSEKTVGSVMRRFKFWDKKERRSPRSRSRSPEERDAEQTERLLSKISVSDTAKPRELSKKDKEKLSDSEISHDEAKVPVSKTAGPEQVERKTSFTSMDVVSKTVSTPNEETEKSRDKKEESLSREQRRARYRRRFGGGSGFSKSMDAAVGISTTSTNDEEEEESSSQTKVQQSERLRERRQLRKLEREKFFASMADGDIVPQEYRPRRLKLKVSLSMDAPETEKRRSQTIASTDHVDIIDSILKESPHLSEENVKPPSIKEMLNRYVSEDDSSKTILDARKTKPQERPHSICGGALSPDEMKKFEDINFSLARKDSSDEPGALKKVDKRFSSSDDTDGRHEGSQERDVPLNAVGHEQEVQKVSPKAEKEAEVLEAKTEKPSRKLSHGEDSTDSHLKSLFRRHKHSSDEEGKKKEKEQGKERIKEKEREKKEKEKVEKERKGREKQKHKEEKEEKLRKDKEKQKLKKEEKEKAKEKLKEVEKDKKSKEKERIKEDEKKVKENVEKKNKETKEKSKEKERKDKEKKERKHKLMEEQKQKTDLKFQEIAERRQSIDTERINEHEFDPHKDREPSEGELPREGSVSALLSLFAKTEAIEKPRHPIQIHKIRPRTLAAGIAPEIIKAARDMVERREKFREQCRTQDDSNVNTRTAARPDSIIEEGGDGTRDENIKKKEEKPKKKESKKCKLNCFIFSF